MPVTDVNSSYVTEFERFDEAHGASSPPWLRAMRQKAITRFTALGFPTTRQEEWRFTNVAPIAERVFRLSVDGGEGLRKEHLKPYRFATSDVLEIVFVNGRFAPQLSGVDHLPAGVSVRHLADVLSHDPGRVAAHLARHADFERQPFGALNTAFLSDGAFIEIAPNAVIGPPVHIIFVSVSAGEVSHPRVLVLAGRNSQVRLVESYVGLSWNVGAQHAVPLPSSRTASFTNAVTEIVLDDGAVVDHCRVQREAAADAFHISTTQLRLAHSSAFTSHAFTFGGAIVRNDVNVLLAGEGGDCTLNGLYLADGSRLVDIHTFIDHAQAHCGSHELYKGILDGRARAVFNGKILVRPDAQKTDAKQTNRTLLLSDDAQINTKPQLEIFANDVKCTHGATVGQLSADALFYVQSRGIDRRAAMQMLIRAFAADITGRVKIDPLREHLDRVLLEALGTNSIASNPAEAGSHETGSRRDGLAEQTEARS
jgi:Fe-S cluster assembly protein SufD